MGTAPIDPDRFNAFEAAGWRGVVAPYHRFFGPITGRAIEPLLDAAAVGPGTRVLDVACGPGYVAAQAALRGASVVGLDRAEEMLALARALHPALELRAGDAEQLPFDDGSLDAVVANFVILHVGRPERVVAEMARVLRRGGRAALSAWDLPVRARLFGVFLEAFDRAGLHAPADLPAGPPFFRFGDDAELAGLLGGAGLDDVSVGTVSFTHRLPDSTALWEGLVGATVRTRALVEHQPAAEKERLREALEAGLAPYRGAAGGLALPVSVRIGAGRRP